MGSYYIPPRGKEGKWGEGSGRGEGGEVAGGSEDQGGGRNGLEEERGGGWHLGFRGGEGRLERYNSESGERGGVPELGTHIQSGTGADNPTS
eukprot:747775-Hanusia_phi.AAC.3